PSAPQAFPCTPYLSASLPGKPANCSSMAPILGWCSIWAALPWPVTPRCWKQSRPDMNLAQWLYSRALVSPEAPALFTGTRQCANYRQFAVQASAVGAYLQQQYGIK